MPRVKYGNFVKKLRKASFFTYRQVESVMGRSYAKLWIHKMLERGEIAKLAKGCYTFKHSPYLLATVLGKAYIGLGSAAFLHGLWNQVISVHVLSPLAGIRVREGRREICGFKVVIRKISEKMYFGFTEIFLEDVGEWVRVSDPEKTLIDMLYYSYPFLEEILPALSCAANRKKLEEYIGIMKRRGVRGWKRIRDALVRERIL